MGDFFKSFEMLVFLVLKGEYLLHKDGSKGERGVRAAAPQPSGDRTPVGWRGQGPGQGGTGAACVPAGRAGECCSSGSAAARTPSRGDRSGEKSEN